ncbi:hypothetical protein M409DRAFT_30526 [Zasmidium cellare ATCC 36951]|uniref:Cytochrome P450 monooxygenase n=1 Tax=Zasmidium cellare ATCC 36951 TaxID=1080233 RepID=A0A6A6BW17_ZASCE|nr:uncharacterized protein M409DRAFT_30526 [Zasmidium cellare ATCC 36951]KAF2158991.1 hypothetical protein M409DRAFT_30526 [Zasmidium cellare ATCC 36951]
MEVASTLLEVARKTPLSIFALGTILSPVFLIACLAVYRLFFHPLSKIPGPLSQKLSGFPRIWHCRQGDRFLREMETHDRYGSVIRIAPNALCFNTLSALQTIYTKDSNVFKGDEFYGLLDGGAEGGRSIMMEADNTAHAARRRVLDKALPPRDQAFRDLNALSKSFAYAVFQEGSADDKGWSKPIDVAPVSAWFSFDLIGTIAFGSPLDMLHEKEYRWVPKCLQSASIFLFWGGYSPFLSFWQWVLGTRIPSILRLQTLQNAQRYADFADWMFHRRAEKLNTGDDLESKRADIFQGLLRSKLYNDLEMRADSSLLIAAGSDAIRLTIAATIFYWLKNPDTFEKAAEEIRGSVASPDEVSESVLASLKYLRACIDETMRLSPAKPSSLPREVMEGGIVVDGIYVPKGATVGVSVYALHHDPDIYPEPYSYDPERWLKQSQDRRMQATFCPFLKGPRACPGKTMAYFAMQLALFHLVYGAPQGGVTADGRTSRHRLRHREGEYQFNDWILGYADGPEVQFKARE